MVTGGGGAANGLPSWTQRFFQVSLYCVLVWVWCSSGVLVVSVVCVVCFDVLCCCFHVYCVVSM